MSAARPSGDAHEKKTEKVPDDSAQEHRYREDKHK